MIPLTGGTRTGKFTEADRREVVTRGWGQGELVVSVHVYVKGGEKVLGIDSDDGYTTS